MPRIARLLLGQQQAVARDALLQGAMRARVVHVEARPKDSDGASARGQRRLVRRAVDPSRQAADDRDTGACAGSGNGTRHA